MLQVCCHHRMHTTRMHCDAAAGDATSASSLNSSKRQAADAAFILAALTASGVAAPHIGHDEASAVGWLQAAAAAGSLEAQAALAVRLETGEGVEQSCEACVR